jgi:hypothetical protein
VDGRLQDACDAVFKLQSIRHKLSGLSYPDQIAKKYQNSRVPSVQDTHAWAVQLAANSHSQTTPPMCTTVEHDVVESEEMGS